MGLPETAFATWVIIAGCPFGLDAKERPKVGKSGFAGSM